MDEMGRGNNKNNIRKLDKPRRNQNLQRFQKICTFQKIHKISKFFKNLNIAKKFAFGQKIRKISQNIRKKIFRKISKISI